jgi:hypothetical protein
MLVKKSEFRPFWNTKSLGWVGSESSEKEKNQAIYRALTWIYGMEKKGKQSRGETLNRSLY